METALRFCGYIGATLIAFGILGSFIVGSFTEQPVLLLHIILGILCLVAWGLTSGLASVREAKGVFTGRTARFGAHAVTYGAVTLGLLIVLNIFVSLNEKRWDLTEQGVYSLSPKSVKVIAAIKSPVKIVAIEEQSSPTKESTRELLKLYKMANDRFVSYELLDPSVNPVEVDTLGMKAGNLIYLEYGEGSAKGVSRLNQVDEQSITNSIIKLSRGAQKRLYYVQGHGEPQLESAAAGGMQELKEALGDEHINVEGLILAQSGVVPEDAAAVVLAGPSRPIPQAERDALISYANRGGRLVLFANPEDRGSDDVRTLAAAFGIKVGDDVILDQQLRLFAGPQLAVQFIAQHFGSHAITTGMSKEAPVVFTFASSVVAADPKGGEGTYVELIKSGNNSWGEQNLSQIFDPAGATASRGDEDLKGPVSIAVALERPSSDKAASEDSSSTDESFKKLTRVVVFGDATWIQNGNLAAMGNRDLLLNSVNWALGEEGGVAIGPKSIRASVAPIPEAKFKLILALSFLGPEFILLFGLFVWWRRRVARVA